MEYEARMAIAPSPRLRVLVRPVIVEDHVHDLARRNLGLDGIQEADELLMPVALHAAPDHLSIEHVERPGWVRSRAWIWLFSSTESTTACAGGST